ncbi:hypothetical protein [Pontibacter akesuensis]|uniref:Uracil DNA glycosylase superfamily protein n=1 Tax=Pontibacter akesuensis TaxID=388950 RepID=A0A1I7JNL9_9BACT|nr:hypothetical protein [Pontibacter akesuensis]GHA68671.1 hypothetical protein GCM10007389_22090 [Pontibacter akesuensis]SFU86746.1 hypothetical protein SAMN04487941_3066 [Pontibacter akesuensis]
METILSTQYDQDFKSTIPHIANYPELLPFVGKNWETSKRILFLGESHYLPYDKLKAYSSFDYFQNWYEGNSFGLGDIYRKYIYTRNNVFIAENGTHEKPLSIYFNLKTALLELPEVSINQEVFSNFSFYNYYQKPAYIKGEKHENRSIQPDLIDDKVAYETLLRVTALTNPKVIIFVSRKAYKSFMQMYSTRNESILKNIKIDSVPHAGRQWWYKKSRSYGDRTGKQKFLDLIKEAYLN